MLRTYHIHPICLKQVILFQTTIQRNFVHKAVFLFMRNIGFITAIGRILVRISQNLEAKVTFLQEMSNIKAFSHPLYLCFLNSVNNDWDQSNQSLLQLLRTSTHRRYKLFAQSNPSSIICNKCDMRFGDINWITSTNKHAKRFEEA